MTPADNLDQIMRVGLRPSIGKRASAYGENAPMVYLFGHREDVDNALMNWLGNEFDDDIALAVLQVECDSVVRGDVDYEFVCFDVIAPEYISLDSIE